MIPSRKRILPEVKIASADKEMAVKLTRWKVCYTVSLHPAIRYPAANIWFNMPNEFGARRQGTGDDTGHRQSYILYPIPCRPWFVSQLPTCVTERALLHSATGQS